MSFILKIDCKLEAICN